MWRLGLMTSPDEEGAARALLRWYVDAGVDEAVLEEPFSRFVEAQAQRAPARAQAATTPIDLARELARPASPSQATVTRIPAQSAPSVDEAVALASRVALQCASLAELAQAVADFDGCPLKAGARNTVFADGVYGAPLLIIGEAPGRDEDSAGKPFVGRAGQLLDKMIAAIGRTRQRDTLITNVVYWRPPGNRTPTQAELAVCRPFVERLIELCAPQAVVLAGGVPTQALTGATSIMRARGQWREVALASGMMVNALPVFHPAFLLRQPAQKRLAWRDMQSLAARLRGD